MPKFRSLRKITKKVMLKYRRALMKYKIKRQAKKRDISFYPSASEGLKHQRGFITFFPKIKFRGGAGRIYEIEIMNNDPFGLGKVVEAKKILTVKTKIDEKTRKSVKQIGWVGLGFEKNSVIIEVMQTSRSDDPKNRVLLNEFRRLSKKQTLNYLLQVAEEQARLCGFEEVKIRIPQTLYYYQKPNTSKIITGVDEVRTAMRVLYQRTAASSGYKKEGLFFVKKI